jgi:hypothetical protein
VYRWPVKTLYDQLAKRVNYHPINSSVVGLVLRSKQSRVHLPGRRDDPRSGVTLTGLRHQGGTFTAQLRQLAGRPQQDRELVMAGHEANQVAVLGDHAPRWVVARTSRRCSWSRSLFGQHRP